MFKVSKGLFAGWTSAVLLVVLLVIYFLATAPVRRARRLLAEIAKVDVGATTLDQFRHQLQNAKLKSVTFTCNGNDCTASDHAEVRSIARYRLAPTTGILTSVTFKDGVAAEIYVWLEIDDHHIADSMGPGTGATIHESPESRSCPQHFCTYVTDRSGYPWAVVELDAAVPREQRDKAFALNVGCLTKIGGCKRPSTILPEVFGKQAGGIRPTN